MDSNRGKRILAHDGKVMSKRPKKSSVNFMTLPVELRLHIYDICLDDWNDSRPAGVDELQRKDFTYGQNLSKFRWSTNVVTPAEMPILRTYFGEEAGAYYIRCKLLVEEHIVDPLAGWADTTTRGHAVLVKVQAIARVLLLIPGHRWVCLHGPAYLVEITQDGQALEVRTKFSLRDDDAGLCKDVAINVVKAAQAAGKKQLDGCDVVEVIKRLVEARRHKRDSIPHSWHAKLTLAELGFSEHGQHKSVDEAAMQFIKEKEKELEYRHKIGSFPLVLATDETA